MNAVRGARPVAALPVVVDPRQLRRRLAAEEDAQRRALAELEDRLRRFEDVERPAYEGWLRLELGPALARLEEHAAELRAREMLAVRVSDLVELDGWHPREALYVAEHGAADEGDGRTRTGHTTYEREEIEARRRAKRDRKRAERKQARRQRAHEGAAAAVTAASAGSRLTELYRGLARRLHPDSPAVLRSLEPGRMRSIWAEVQSAYAGRSVERLLALSAWIETAAGREPDAATDAAEPSALLSMAERYDRLRALRRSRAAVERRLEHLAAEPAWGFASAPPRVRRRLKKEAARRLEEQLGEACAALAEVESWLAAIGTARRPRVRR